MKLRALLELVDLAYGPDGLVLAYDDEPDTAHGDGLAEFVRNEIVDTYESDAEAFAQFEQAAACLRSAIRQLSNCVRALETAQRVSADGRAL